MGRIKINDEQTPARFPTGTLARIDSVLDTEANEKRSDLIREAVERELKRRAKKISELSSHNPRRIK
jgi:metal-responsive CopG/Arc/MetJ family transcriptional regulator